MQRTVHSYPIIVIGTSAGGVEALTTLVAGLPSDFGAAVFVVIHLPITATGVMAQILSRAGTLPAKYAENNMIIEPGHVYVAPADRHLILSSGLMHLTSTAKENHARPAVDPLFRSAARAYGDRVVGVILTGALDDGSVGLAAVKMHGGVAIVQDPEDAAFASMPLHASQSTTVDFSLPLDEIAPQLVRLVAAGKDSDTVLPAPALIGTHINGLDPLQEDADWNHPSVYTCPECHGMLWELESGKLLHYRCRVGHAYSPASLAVGQTAYAETALLTAMRALDEQRSLADHLSKRAADHGHEGVALHFRERADHVARSTDILRELVEDVVAALAESRVPPHLS